ncbi:MAG: protein phosphatase 2C domain-containing protein [Deltaproteobacteria bacterium]|nr:protein phosphatase 2C domain-containing protein [Deltaproteobacteria bacterium]
MKHRYSLASDRGPRKSNQDKGLADPKRGLFVVADGMGGYAGGEVASALAVEAVAELITRDHDDAESTLPFGYPPDVDPMPGLLDVAFRAADERVRERRQGALSNMGTTMVALLARGSRVALAHVGDSRIYRFDQTGLEQLTRDHSLYEELRAVGSAVPPLTEYAYANVITRAIGAESRADLLILDVAEPVTFLLCSDGLSGALDAETMAEILRSVPAERAADVLVSDALTAGASDNVTALVVGLEP